MNLLLLAFALSLSKGLPAQAETWSRAYIRALPDSAFASVEVDAQERKHRHLPHHDADGRVDIPHVRSALARFGQVRWIDPKDAAPALAHLRAHLSVR